MDRVSKHEIDGVTFICDAPVTKEEAAQYVKRERKLYHGNLIGVNAHVDGDYIELAPVLRNAPKFERTRRITGYLSTTNRFNDAKTAELRDRVKHEVDHDR